MRAVTTTTTIEFSASDLSQFLGCRHLTALELAVARGLQTAPTWIDPALILLQQRGLEHERCYIEALRNEGLEVVDLSEHSSDDAVARSTEVAKAEEGRGLSGETSSPAG